MKITIDTKEDSHHEIKKVINLLSHLIGEEGHIAAPGTRNIFEDDTDTVSETTSEQQGGILGSLFGNDSSSSESDTKKDTDEFEEEEKEDSVQMMEYY